MPEIALVQSVGATQLAGQGVDEALGEHRDPIFLSFSVADDELAAEVR